MKIALIILSFIFTIPPVVLSQNFTSKRILAENPDFPFVIQTNENFGSSVSIYDNIAVVGARRSNLKSGASGAVFVYQFENGIWKRDTALTSDTNFSLNDFGRTTDLYESTLVVGSPGEGLGAIYVYELDSLGKWNALKINASDGLSNSNFGFSVAIDQERIVVGDPNQNGMGAVYVFEKDNSDNWTETKITASDAAINRDFGFSVDIQDSTIIVGDKAIFGPGFAYLYQKDLQGNWQETKFIPADSHFTDRFGISVSIQDSLFVVGASLGDGLNDNLTGCAYIFEENTTGIWEETKIFASDISNFSNFGFSTSIWNAKILIGALDGDGIEPSSGALYSYSKNSNGIWEEEKIISDLMTEDSSFGISIDQYGDKIIAGATDFSGVQNESGTALVLSDFGSNGHNEVELSVGLSLARMEFGHSIAANDNFLIVGATNYDGPELNTGGVFLYKINNNGVLEQNQIFSPIDLESSDEFGSSVAIGDSIIVATAIDDVENGIGSGSAYIFELDGMGIWNETKVIPSNGSIDDHFGSSCLVYKDSLIIIGSTGFDSDISNVGAIYLYHKDAQGNWTEEFLTDSTLANADGFGSSLAYRHEEIIAGAPGRDVNGTNSGSVFSFEKNGSGEWISQEIFPSDAFAFDSFGNSVAASEQFIFVGCINDDDNGTNSGSLYIFETDAGGSLIEHKIANPNANLGSKFGELIELYGDTAFVASQSTSHYLIFRNSSNVFETRHLLRDPAYSYVNYNSAIAINQGSLFIADSENIALGFRSGAVFEFNKLSVQYPLACESFNFERTPSGLFSEQSSGTYTKLNWTHYSDATDACILQGGTITTPSPNAPFNQNSGKVIVQGGQVNGLPDGLDFSANLGPNAQYQLFNPLTYPNGPSANLIAGAHYKWRVQCGCIIDNSLPFPARLALSNVHLSPWSEYSVFSNLTLNPSIESPSQNQFKNGVVQDEFSIYPNPSMGQFVLTGPASNYSIFIRDSQGKLVHSQSAKNQRFLSIDLSKHSKGIYFVSILSPALNTVKKIVIE